MRNSSAYTRFKTPLSRFKVTVLALCNVVLLSGQIVLGDPVQICKSFYQVPENSPSPKPKVPRISPVALAETTYSSLQNVSIQPSIASHFVVAKLSQSLNQTAPIESSAQFSKEFDSKVAAIVEKNQKIEGIVNDLKNLITEFKKAVPPFNIRIRGRTEAYNQKQMLEIVNTFEFLTRETQLLEGMLPVLKDLQMELEPRLTMAANDIEAHQIYHQDIVEFNSRLLELMSQNPGSSQSERAGQIFSLMSQEIQNHSSLASRLVALHHILQMRDSELKSLDIFKAKLPLLDLKIFLLESGFSESKAQELLAQIPTLGIKVPFSVRMARPIRAAKKALSVAVLGAAIAGGTAYYKAESPILTEIKAVSPKAYDSIIASHNADSAVRDEMLTHAYFTAREKLTGEQVKFIADRFSTGNTWFPKSVILEDFAELNSKNPVIEGMYRKIPPMKAQIELIKQTGQYETKNDLIVLVYHQHRQNLSAVEVKYLTDLIGYYNGSDHKKHITNDYAQLISQRK